MSARFSQDHLDAFADLIRRAFPDGLSQEEGRLVYAVLAGGEVVMEDGRRLHRSWRGTGAAICEAGAPGDYVDYYLGFRAHDDPALEPVRERFLTLPDVARIEQAPREGAPLYFPQEEEDPSHETGWGLSVVYESPSYLRRLAEQRQAGPRPASADVSAWEDSGAPLEA